MGNRRKNHFCLKAELHNRRYYHEIRIQKHPFQSWRTDLRLTKRQPWPPFPSHGGRRNYQNYVDCGDHPKRKVVNFQLWSADDYDHRLEPRKVEIISMAEKQIGENLEIEVEYQFTIGLDFDGKRFHAAGLPRQGKMRYI